MGAASGDVLIASTQNPFDTLLCAQAGRAGEAGGAVSECSADAAGRFCLSSLTGGQGPFFQAISLESDNGCYVNLRPHETPAWRSFAPALSSPPLPAARLSDRPVARF